MRIVFVGTITKHFAFSTVVAAARECASLGCGVDFILCGEGDQLADLRRASASLPNLALIGWQPGHVIWELLRRSHCGIAPYLGGGTFDQSIPNKIIEYFSAGLPVVSSLGGQTRALLAQHGAGWSFGAKDPRGLVELVQRLLADRPEVRRAGRRAADIFERDFRAEVVYEQFARHIEALVLSVGRSQRSGTGAARGG